MVNSEGKMMIKNITLSWLNEKSACADGIKWFQNQAEIDTLKVIKKLISEEKFDWAHWLICKLSTHKQKVLYTIYAAEQAIYIYEEKYPNDDRSRKAIEAAKKCMDNPTEENQNAAYEAGNAAVNAAYTASDEIYQSAYATYNAAYAAANGAFAESAANAAYNSADIDMRLKLLNYGIELLMIG